ncbi:MAG: T9SS type A sorting domain-containing protein [Reichenbachiella sp.]|uniref:T9SS type A sorting domain-containing protein n=1 Tax=Reichenbachiella sp. TaxID=2184521 RepID=UPI003267C66F
MQILFLIGLGFPFNVMAQTTIGENDTGADLWTDGTNWDNGQPACGSHTDIVIPNGVTMIIRNTDIDLSACDLTITIESGGTLRFGSNNGNTSSLTLSLNSTIVVESGAQIEANTVGTSTGPEITITIGTNETWDGSDGDITVEGTMDETTTDGALPVKLLSFLAYSVDKSVNIEWVTAWESNNDYFSLERSEDGIDFYTIQTIAGAGTSDEKLKYVAFDKEPIMGISYYRLSQTDFDGESETFDPVRLYSNVPSNPGLDVYPNPTDDFVTILLNEDELQQFNIFDLNGNEIEAPQSSRTSGSLEIYLGSLKPGTYLIKTATRSERVIVK